MLDLLDDGRVELVVAVPGPQPVREAPARGGVRLTAAGLGFLGLGAQPPSSDWGLMISEARSFIDRAPWIALAPGFAMCLLVVLADRQVLPLC